MDTHLITRRYTVATYEVTVRVIEKYELEVEADSKEDARDKVEAILESEGKHEYHADSDVEMDIFEV